ncbi:peptidase M50 [Anopheles sinensis]|uniref:Peptidase M50 n=1 Tax=Anopheles sinensis TaxID=74873 RepID=A0A084VB26_ANOSI|nr:peptidase M50 [Anopheles sinensis]
MRRNRVRVAAGQFTRVRSEKHIRKADQCRRIRQPAETGGKQITGLNPLLPSAAGVIVRPADPVDTGQLPGYLDCWRWIRASVHNELIIISAIVCHGLDGWIRLG